MTNRKWLLGLLLVLMIILVAGVAGAARPSENPILLKPGESKTITLTASGIPPEDEIQYVSYSSESEYISVGCEDTGFKGSLSITITAAAGIPGGSYAVEITYELGGSGYPDSTTVTVTVDEYAITGLDNVQYSDKKTLKLTKNGEQITGYIVIGDTGKSIQSGEEYTFADGTGAFTIKAYLNQGDHDPVCTSSMTVSPKELTVSGITASNRPYDGTKAVPLDLTNMSIVGIYNNEDVSVEVNAMYASADAYTGKRSDLFYTLTGEKKGNYTVSSQSQGYVEADITPIEVTVALTAEKEFDNSTTLTKDNFNLTGATITPGAIEGETLTVTDASGSFSDVNVGDSKTITISKDDVDLSSANYVVTSVSATGKITARAITNAAIAAIDDETYNGGSIVPTLTVTDAGINYTLVKDTDYEIDWGTTDHTNAKNGVQLTITPKGNYTTGSDANPSQTFNILPKSIEGVTVSTIPNETYDRNQHTPKPTVTDEDISATPLLEDQDYTLSWSENINAGQATVTITGKGNYDDQTQATANFTIDPAEATPDLVVNAENDLRYNNGTELKPAITVTIDVDVSLKEGDDFTVAYTDNVDAGEATVTITEADSATGNGKNYTWTEKDVSVKFTIEPAELATLSFPETSTQVYKRAVYNPNDDLKQFSKLTAVGFNGKPAEWTIDDTELYTLTCGATIQNVGDYTIEAMPSATGTNYTGKSTAATFTIVRKKVKELKLTVNGPEADNSRLGGPKADQYHTITLDAEPGEIVDVTITGGDGTVITTIKATAGDITIEDGAINGVKLPDTTGDVKYTITAKYEDYDNLTNDAESATATPTKVVSENFYYDTVAKPVTVGQLMNRAATGVPVTLAEDYSKVTFTSTGAGENFTATSGLLRAGSHTIGFDNVSNPKLQSTTRYGSSYSGSATDLVGNTVPIPNQEIYQSTGTLLINSIDPAINGANKIGKQDSITLSVTMTAPGGHSELVSMTPGGGRTLTQGEQAITISADALGRDAYITPSVAFDDLIGSATFQSFVYDPQCDDPVLTSTLYGGCYILAGVVEPGSAIRAEIGGEFYRTNADAYGTFIISMPSTNSGDIVIIHVTDQAGNGTKKEFTVGEEEDPVKMTAFMQGKQYTNAHNAPDGTPLGFTNVLSVKPDDIKAGLVKLPIIAGNIVQVGEITLAMDDAGTLSYSYTLEDGVVVNSENMVLLKKLSAQDAIDLNGEPISKDGTVVPVNGNQPILLVGRFEVSVPAEMLESTFQTETVKDSELKKIYRDRQNNRPFK